MGNRTAKFMSALIGTVIAGAPLAAVSQNAPTPPSAASTTNAASDCLASPKGATPQGQHWFYRLDRATKRQCWYLRAEGSKATQSAQTTSDTPDAVPAAPPSVQNARAEYVAPQTSPAASAPAPATASPQPAPGIAADGNAPQPAAVTRDPDAAAATTSPAPQSAPASAPETAAEQPSAQPTTPPAPATPAATDSAAEKPTGSLQMLLLVIGGALALAGLLASVIYRFAGGRVRVQTADRRVNWDNRQDRDDSRAPWLNAVPAPAPRVERPLPIDFDAIRPQARQIAAFSDAIGRIAAQGRPTEIATAEVDETEDEAEIDYFEGEFEIEAPALQLAADSHDEETVDRDADAHQEHAGDAEVHEEHAHHEEDHARDEKSVDIDIITALLERLAAEGPRLSQPSFEPSLEADLAALARSSRGQSAARA
ncbi:hypothetical protein ACFQZO_12770 [Bradyrhizobium sp. GCM10027634]|uniref:hypothetical protein n=1 Tax=unclassified Bradyrhizobium TaxID=2631580 RepID=UPI00188B2ED9|nr:MULTISPECIES: hypothetical protein [unclassified Bradyrhizobium]MDN5001758.1 hypothetical protein [Bradyrhizobium sp. WYCCWR 12677]QOZ45923.1 hypothetical protein XH89_22440 [Bradyrhizobium sp. CCBAU 53340]